MHKSSHPRLTLTSLAIATAALLIGGASSAGASSSIEAVWSFGGGQIAVVPLANGTFEGTVVAPIKFAECVHPEGQEIWKDVTLRPDGSYWGGHQWYFAGSDCTENPEPGPTAWRVIEEPDGSKYLKVCFSEPGTTQPTIAPDGSVEDVQWGCRDSALIAPLPPLEPSPSTPTSQTTPTSTSTTGSSSGNASFIQRQLPAAKRCLSARDFPIHLAEPQYDPFKTISVTLKGHAIKTRRKGKYVVATIDLEGLPPGAFTVKIKATTVLGVHLSGSRTYHTCAKKPKKHKPSKLKVSK
ncbi:MAG TPA: hypothetical protein VMF09_03580 [Solirubrobacteraceae bacterium]|nr:hypothetical protein [Solirubrobacteraceae bacterium]